MNRRQIPAFGNWEYCDDLPITQYFESAVQAGFLRTSHLLSEEKDDEDPAAAAAADLFKIKPRHHHHHQQQIARNEGKKGERRREGERKGKQGKACHVARPRAPTAVDEDLYKIPPELLYQKPKRKRLLRSLWSGCLGLSCIA